MGGGKGDAPLPIELISYSAHEKGNNVLLRWRTASEYNTDYFVIKRFQDNLEKIELERVKASGFSSSIVSYEFEDQNSPIGILYYELEQYDLDGTCAHKKIISLNHTLKTTDLLFINDNDRIIIQNIKDEMVEILLFNQSGNLLYSKNEQTINGNSELDVSKYNMGLYYICVIQATAQIKVCKKVLLN